MTNSFIDAAVAERWKIIPNVKGAYSISDYGRVFSYQRKSILKGTGERYRYVRLSTNDGRWGKFYIHRLVGQMYVSKPSLDCIHINHKDGNKNNNYYQNLEWTTQRRNNRHAFRNGLLPSGEEHHWSKLKQSQVDEIRSLKNIVSQRSIAKRYEVTQQNISAIQRGASWNTMERCADE